VADGGRAWRSFFGLSVLGRNFLTHRFNHLFPAVLKGELTTVSEGREPRIALPAFSCEARAAASNLAIKISASIEIPRALSQSNARRWTLSFLFDFRCDLQHKMRRAWLAKIC
jgi:hypothetical protein